MTRKRVTVLNTNRRETFMSIEPAQYSFSLSHVRLQSDVFPVILEFCRYDEGKFKRMGIQFHDISSDDLSTPSQQASGGLILPMYTKIGNLCLLFR